MTHDPVNSPAHYAEGRLFEPISVIEDWELNYRLGNALKYISRAGRKQNAAEDLKKAIWYLEREIEALKGNWPYAVNYEDVIDYYGQSTEIDAWPEPDVDTIGDTGFGEAGVPADAWEQATEQSLADEWLAWEAFDAWDPSVGPVEPTLSAEEITELLGRKSLHQFADNEIVATVEKRGFVLGVKKDGTTCELNSKGGCK